MRRLLPDELRPASGEGAPAAHAPAAAQVPPCAPAPEPHAVQREHDYPLFEQLLPATPESSAITADAVRQLYANAPASIGANIACALLCVAVQRPVLPLAGLLEWLSLFLLVTLARTGLVLAYHRGPATHLTRSRTWLQRFRAGVLATGMMWGLAAIALFPQSDVMHQMILTAFLLGVCAAVVLSNAVDAAGAAGFTIAVIAPFVVHMSLREGDLYRVQAALGIVYFGFIAAIIRQVSVRARETSLLRIDAAAREEALKVTTEQYRLLLNHLPVGVLHYDKEFRIRYCNVRLAALLQTSAEKLVGTDLRSLHDLKILATLRKVIVEGVSERYEGYHDAVLGALRGWISVEATASRDARGNIVGGVAIVADVTEQHTSQEEIQRLVFFDTLTGLPNRRWLVDRLKQALKKCGRTGHYSALLYIDLDNFKTLNDTRGHDVGDQLLQKVAKRLSGRVRSSDSVARTGGDEFVVLLENLRGDAEQAAASARAVGEDIRATLNQAFRLGSHDYYCTPSIGVSVFGDHPVNEDELLKQADVAMYQAKAAGRNTLRFFDARSQSVIVAQSALEADLRVAIRERQLVLHYQPLVDSSYAVVGAEALVRWNHPERGLVPPADFIPVAESTGLILPLGRWVLETACRQLASWASRPDRADLTLAVNISALQIRQADFVPEVLAIAQRSGANPGRLKLELTESVFVDDVEDTIAKMQALNASGIGFSLDDFGTGYSSLSYLKRLPLDQLKIDRSFVSNLELDDSDASICAATIGLAHNLGRKVVAEGVETDAQCYFLNTVHRCDYMQGYYFGRPLPIAQFEEALDQRRGADPGAAPARLRVAPAT